MFKWLSRWLRKIPNRIGTVGDRGPFPSEDEIVEDMLVGIKNDPASLNSWMSVNRKDLILGHHTTGQYIRNHYGLWRSGNPLVDSEDLGDRHPDGISMRIMKRVWDRLHDRSRGS